MDSLNPPLLFLVVVSASVFRDLTFLQFTDLIVGLIMENHSIFSGVNRLEFFLY